jgi:UDP-N-acetylmuramoylalanine-D-glutamate ligase
MQLHGWQGKKVALYGLGKSGMATATACLQAGAEVIAWDNGAAARTDTTCVTRICISWIGRLRVLPPWC